MAVERAGLSPLPFQKKWYAPMAGGVGGCAVETIGTCAPVSHLAGKVLVPRALGRGKQAEVVARVLFMAILGGTKPRPPWEFPAHHPGPAGPPRPGSQMQVLIGTGGSGLKPGWGCRGLIQLPTLCLLGQLCLRDDTASCHQQTLSPVTLGMLGRNP